MDKNMSEYDSLRNEIISMEDQQRNVWLYMYLIYTTLFVLGLEFSYSIFLVTYIILIPFQLVINRYKWSITKMSTYIRIFYEKNDHTLNWESLHMYYEYKMYYKKNINSFLNVIQRTGSVQLSLLSSAFYIINLLNNNIIDNHFLLSFLDIFLIIISIILFCLVFILNKNYNENYNEELEHIISNYCEKQASDQKENL